MTDFAKADNRRIEHESKAMSNAEKQREKSRMQTIRFSTVSTETLWEVSGRRRAIGRVIALFVGVAAFACLCWWAYVGPWYMYFLLVVLGFVTIVSLRYLVDDTFLFEKWPCIPAEFLFFTNRDGLEDEIVRRNKAKKAYRGIPEPVIIDGEISESEAGNGVLVICVDSDIFGPLVLNFAEANNYYGVKLLSLNEAFREQWEPRSAAYRKRIVTLRRIHEAGYKTWVSLDPFPALTSNGHIERYGFKCFSEDGTVDFSVPKGEVEKDDNLFGELYDCLGVVSFVDLIYFGRWNDSDKMPTNVEDPDAWYKEAAVIVRDFCKERGITCTIGEGIE
jgi:hypothetical protein